MTNTTRRALSLVAVASCAAAAQAGDIYATYNFDLFQQASFVYLGNGYSPNTARAINVRTGGSTTLLPGPGYVFNTYCVEVGQTISGGGNYHASVTPLLGSSTNTGGITGPIFFDAARTAALECLWGTYFPTIGGNQTMSAAFQLAQWEIAFDNGLDLSNGAMTSTDAVAGLAQGMLSGIASGQASIKQKLVLLSSPDIQDLVTPVPEPSAIIAMGVGSIALFARRRRK